MIFFYQNRVVQHLSSNLNLPKFLVLEVEFITNLSWLGVYWKGSVLVKSV